MSRSVLIAVLVATGLACLPTQAASLEARIVNGLPTHGYPTTGALLYTGTGDERAAGIQCSGTLIGCETFITAAHCVEDDPKPENYYVYLQHGGVYAVSAVNAHPSYSFPIADVAVLKLSKQVMGIDPTPVNLTDPAPLIPHAGTIVGFGQSLGGVGDYGIKRMGTVVTADCSSSSGGSNTELICWDYDEPVGPAGEDSNTCNGDSGGPIFMDFGAGDVLAGITSGGSAGDCDTGDHSYDSNAYNYSSFILTHLGTDDTASCGGLPAVGGGEVVVQGESGSLGSGGSDSYTVTLTAGITLLRVVMNGEDNWSLDSDLYVKHGGPASAADHDCKADGSSVFGGCEIAAPAAGAWHFTVASSSGSGQYQATATVFGGDPPVCGNDVAEFGEQCDGADSSRCSGLCTVDCDCPAPVCGNNVIEEGETCDGSEDSVCPGLCGASGSATECTCCGDGVCGQGETGANCAADCGCVAAGACGDEAPGGCWCDDGCVEAGDCCSDACSVCGYCPPLCGNGDLDEGEGCDDGNNTDGDGCDSNCTLTACGNGVVTSGEECDDGNQSDVDSCLSDCTVARCGDGLINLEQVPGYTGLGTGFDWRDISSVATGLVLGDDEVSSALPLGFDLTFYGEKYSELYVSSNGFITFDESADAGCCSGQTLPTTYEPNNLVAAYWTDLDPSSGGVYSYAQLPGLFVIEAKDVPHYDDLGVPASFQYQLYESGNRIEIHYLSVVADSEATGGIEDGSGSLGEQHYDGSGALVSWAIAYAVMPAEQCDDGNTVDDDGCDSNCTATACGNGVITTGEQCEDGNTNDGDGCDSNCTPTACGNAVVTSGEECDDGNEADQDACISDCTLAVCGDGFVNIAPRAEYASSDIAFNWRDVSGVATELVLDDDEVSAALPLGFIFDFYDTEYSETYVSSNGFITFDATAEDGCCEGAVLPDSTEPDNLIAAYWADLDPSLGGTYSHAQLAGLFVVEADEVPLYGEPEQINSFQYQLYQNGSRIELHYLSVLANPDATAGIEDETGSAGEQHYAGQSDLGAWAIAYARVAVEQCDDGNLADGDGCSSTCMTELGSAVCGNGVLEAGEDCDDGNSTDGDGCSSGCRLERVQSRAQQKCITKLNKAGAKVARIQGKINVRCIVQAGKGREDDAAACTVGDASGRLAKAKAKTVATAQKCSAGPDFGYGGATAVNDAASGQELSLLYDVYGGDLNSALLSAAVDKPGAYCQASVAKAYEKIAAAKISVFSKCVKLGLKAGLIDSTARLEGCFDEVINDSRGRIARSIAKLERAIGGKCGPVLDDVFPGACQGQPQMTQCIDTLVECRVCRTLNAMDALGQDCDAFDDGLLNGSCQ